jgi:hypothetical protein
MDLSASGVCVASFEESCGRYIGGPEAASLSGVLSRVLSGVIRAARRTTWPTPISCWKSAR